MAIVEARFVVGGTNLNGLKTGNTLIVNGGEERVYDVEKIGFSDNYRITCLRKMNGNGMEFIVDNRYNASEKMLKQGKLDQGAWLSARELPVPKKGIIARWFMSPEDRYKLEQDEKERAQFNQYHRFLEAYQQ